MAIKTCSQCGKEFESARSEEEAEAEYALLFPNEHRAQLPRAIVCHGCFIAIMAGTSVSS